MFVAGLLLFISTLIFCDFAFPQSINAQSVRIEGDFGVYHRPDGTTWICAYTHPHDDPHTHQITLFTLLPDGTVTQHTVASSLYQPPASQPDIAVDEQNNIHIVYSMPDTAFATTNTLQYAFSQDGGETFSITLLPASVRMPVVITTDEHVIIAAGDEAPRNLAGFQFFWDSFTSIYDEPLPLRGYDTLEGPVHCNGDIWIMQGMGQPQCNDLVTLSGSLSGTYQTGQFYGGLIQNFAQYELPTQAALARQNGAHPVTDPETDIFYVKLDGSTWSSMVGKITHTVQDVPVYSWFPQDAAQVQAVIDAGGNWYEDTQVVQMSQVAVRDTLWTPGPSGAINGGSVFVDFGELWLEGSVDGRITFACADTVIITGDITYAHTQAGMAPVSNSQDFLGVISEKSILIGYKNYDPWTQQVNDANCSDVLIYGSYAALGYGDPAIYGSFASLHDGVFSFQYQHPHGSTPDFIAPSPYTLNDTLYTMVDLHKFVYPVQPNLPTNLLGFNMHSAMPPMGGGTCGYPYESSSYVASYPNTSNYQFPYGTDWPYYNPVWPESAEDIVYERGTITLYGSVGQRRAGFVHRSGSDPNSHNAACEWNPAQGLYGGDHPSTGYTKDYHYDARLRTDFPPDFVQVFTAEPVAVQTFTATIGSSDFVQNEVYQTAPEGVFAVHSAADDALIASLISRDDGAELVYSTDAGQSFTTQSITPFAEIHDFLVNDGECYVTTSSFSELYRISLDGQITAIPLPAGTTSNAYVSGLLVHEDQYLRVGIGSPDDNLSCVYGDGTAFDEVMVDVAGYGMSQAQHFTLVDLPDNQIGLYFLEQDDQGWNCLRTTGSIDGFTTVGQMPSVPACQLSNHPNPFNPSTEISFSLSNEQYEPVAIEIFNIRGQKVKSINVTLSLSKCDTGKNNYPSFDELRMTQAGSYQTYSTTWDGTDSDNRPVATGLYFYQLKVGNTAVAQKKMMLLK
jgi:hypothetical protein